jgi:hypothetical protein
LQHNFTQLFLLNQLFASLGSNACRLYQSSQECVNVATS